MTESEQQPAWAEAEVYPAKPEGAPYGALSRQGRRSEFASAEALAVHVRSSREGVVAVWTPATARTVPPEAVADLLEPLRHRFVDLAESDASDARRNSMLFGGLLLWALYAVLANGKAPQESMEVGIAALLLLVLGLFPWYEARKARREAWELDETSLATEEEEARFDRWLHQRPIRLTFVLLGCLVLAGAVQVWVELPWAVEAAGLVKERYAAGEWWRLLTAGFVHGNALHWFLNAAGLWYLGRRVEVLAGWPHLVLVFLVSLAAGGMATARMAPGLPSVGASGGLLGLLGFLLVFETLHSRLVPRPARRRLLAALLGTFVIGVVVHRFIDNWAHAGGLVAGALYAAIVFPRSRTARRPRVNRLDVAAGSAGVVVLVGALVVAVVHMLAG